MRRYTKTTLLRAAILLMAASCLLPAQSSGQTIADAKSISGSALNLANGALALAKSTAIEFAAPVTAAKKDPKLGAAAEAARSASETAATYAIAAAQFAVDLANTPMPTDSQIADALSAAHVARAAAQRADAAVAIARAAYYRIIAVDAKGKALADASDQIAQASEFQALSEDAVAAAFGQRVFDLKGTPDPRTLQALAQNRQAQAQLKLAASQAKLVPAPVIAAAPQPGKIFVLAGNTTAKVKTGLASGANVPPQVEDIAITYNLDRQAAVNGTPDAKATLALNLSPTFNGQPWDRIYVIFTFNYKKALITLPTRSRVRLSPDNNESYKFAATDLQVIASEFIDDINAMAPPGSINPDAPIDKTPVIVTIYDDKTGTLLDTLTGWLTITPTLVNPGN